MPDTPLSILLLEDSRADAELLAARLERAGVEFSITRADSKRAFEAAVSGPAAFDLILADFQLPDYDGSSALALARTNRAETPFIFVSGVMGEDVAVDAVQRGATDYVLKTRMDRLGPAVRRAVQLASERRQRQAVEAELRATEQRFNEDRERLLAGEQKARAEAEAANRAKDAFLAVLSHELRTPLSPILMTCHLLAQDETVPPHVADSIEVIRRNTELEARLIDDLLDLTRITRGKLRLNLAPIDLHTLLRATLEICRADIEAKQLAVRFAPGATRVRVAGDTARLQQVFWNVLKNAVKFTPAGGTISITTADAADDRVSVSVTDTGIGIDESALGRIFSAFEQSDVSIVRRFGGLGLGLAIARALVDMHGGTIAACSAGLGHGATFDLTLPATAGAAITPTPANKPAPTGKALRLLLVEDHPDTARMMQVALKRSGHHVDVAHNAAGGAALLRAGGYDLLLSDIGLPDGSGLDVVAAMPMPAVPSIALTGFGMDHDVARSKAAGFTEHLTKPVDVENLLATIRRLTSESVSK